MDVQTIKLDLINWITSLNDTDVIDKIKSIKNNDANLVDALFEENKQVKQLLDERLKEKTTDFIDARASLKSIREQHGL